MEAPKTNNSYTASHTLNYPRIFLPKSQIVRSSALIKFLGHCLEGLVEIYDHFWGTPKHQQTRFRNPFLGLWWSGHKTTARNIMIIRHGPQWDHKHKHEHFFGRNLETCTQKSHHNGKNPCYVNAYAGLELLARNIFIFGHLRFISSRSR